MMRGGTGFVALQLALGCFDTSISHPARNPCRMPVTTQPGLWDVADTRNDEEKSIAVLVYIKRDDGSS
jgi:hypothetical protein